MKKLFFLSIFIFIITSVCSASTLTTNYSLSKPGAGDTDWGSEVNANFDTIDSQMKTNATAISSADHTDHGDGANCTAGSYPLGVDAEGAVQTCTDASTEIDSILATGLATQDTCAEITGCVESAIVAGDVPGLETDAAHDTCTEITNCVPSAYDAVADFSTTLTDTYVCRYNLAGTEINCDVDPAGLGGGTDDQTIDVLSLGGTTLSISLEDDGEANQTVDLVSLQDGTGTDDQICSEVTGCVTDAQAGDTELSTIAALTETNGAVMFVAGGEWTADTTPAIDCTDCTNVGGAETNSLETLATNILDDEILVGTTSAGVGAYQAIPDCDLAGSALAYNQSTNVVSCRSGFSAGSGITSFQMEDADGTEVTIDDAKEFKFVESTGLDIDFTDITPGSDADPFDLTFTLDSDLATISGLTATSGNVMFAAGSAWTSDATPAIVGTDFTGTASGLTAGAVSTITGLAPDTQNTYARTQYLIPYASSTTAFGEIAIGTDGQVLTSGGPGAAPTFEDAAGAGLWTDLTPNLEPNDDGDGIQINDSTGSDYVVQSHDGTDYNFAGTGTTQYTFDLPLEIAGDPLIDADGAVGMDYGSADITDHTFISDGGSAIIDGSISAAENATPSIDFDDSDDTGSVDASIDINCPTTGDCDMDFIVDVATSQTSVMRIDTTDAGVASLNMDMPIYIKEQADAGADVAAYGQIWVNTATPNELWWTDDAGTDAQLGQSGGSAGLVLQLEPKNAKLPATNPMGIDAGNLQWRGLFDDTTDECARWQAVATPYNGGTLTAEIAYTLETTSSSAIVEFEVYVMAVSSGDSADVDTDSFDTVNDFSSGSVSTTAGYLNTLSGTVTNKDSLAEDDLIIIKVCRDSDSTDTTPDDVELRGINIHE